MVWPATRLVSYIAVSTIFAGLLSLSSCQDKKPPSYLIIAADRLSFNSFSCNEDRSATLSGLEILCRESVRLTNAYTTSTQSAAALASLLTGTYPYRHSLHRSFDRINPRLPLLSEMFKKKNYRTSFWSAKPTIMRKTGLSRGFDIFDDTSFIGRSHYSVNFNEQTQQFENWMNESHEPYFAVIYNSDLGTLNEGQAQNSPQEIFDERLGAFFNRLKAAGQWEKNYIIVTGLQGQSSYSRPEESDASNLHSENTNVAIFIKPPRQKGDEGIGWKLDSLVSLADIGFSLLKPPQRPEPAAPDLAIGLYDLSQLWSTSSPLKALPDLEQRSILIEATDPWSIEPHLRFAIYSENYLITESDRVNEFSVFNRLTDGLETINLSQSQPEQVAKAQLIIQPLRRMTGLKKWNRSASQNEDWVVQNQQYWKEPNRRAELFEAEKRRLQSRQAEAQPLSTLLIFFLNPKIEKGPLYEEARRHSYNLSIENTWGLWDANRIWPQPTLSTENQ